MISVKLNNMLSNKIKKQLGSKGTLLVYKPFNNAGVPKTRPSSGTSICFSETQCDK